MEPPLGRRRAVGGARSGQGGPRSALAWVVIVAAAVLPYLGSLDFPLLHDDRTILDNAWLRDAAGPASVLRHDFWFGTRHAGSDLYRPVTVLTLAWNLRLAPGRIGFRATNVALHAAAALLVAAVLDALFRRDRQHAGRLSSGVLHPAAWLGALVFAVHPLASEVVLLAVGRAESLATIFGLSGFLLQLRNGGKAEASGWPAALASGALLFLALLSKESAASWMVILGFWHLAVRRVPGPLPGADWRPAASWAAALAGFLALRGSVVGWAPHLPPKIDNPLAFVDAPTRVANAVLLFGSYLARMVLPVRVGVEHGYADTWARPLLPWAGPAAVAIAVGWTLGFVVLLRRRPVLAFLGSAIPAAFAVTSNLLFPVGAAFAERFAYLPLVFACGLAGFALSRISPRGVRASIVVAVLATFAARTAVRSFDFRSLARFHEATHLAAPDSAKALFNLGRTRLEKQERAAEAADLLEKALALEPEWPRAHRLLASAYRKLGREADAARHERLAVTTRSAPAAGGDEEP